MLRTVGQTCMRLTLAGEWVDDLLLDTLLALRQTLVLDANKPSDIEPAHRDGTTDLADSHRGLCGCLRQRRGPQGGKAGTWTG